MSLILISLSPGSRFKYEPWDHVLGHSKSVLQIVPKGKVSCVVRLSRYVPSIHVIHVREGSWKETCHFKLYA